MSGVIVVLMGEPVAWARTRLGPNNVPFNPTKQRNNAAALQVVAMEAMAGRDLFDCALRVDMEAQFSIPASWSQRKREAAMRGEIRPAKRPDLSNIVKQVEDAFNGVVYRDDSLIVEYGKLRKVYSGQPKIVVAIQPMFPIPGLAEMRNDVLDDMVDAGAG